MKWKREHRGRSVAAFCALCLALFAGHEARALEWLSAGPHRSAAVAVPAGGRAGFTSMPGAVTGISFTNVLPQSRHLTNQVLLNGSGVTAGDVDGDGWCDVYFCGLDRPNALYRNMGGWKFVDITAEAGVACAGLTSSGCALVDFDGDGDLDLVVSTVGHGTRVFANDGKGRFTEVAVLNGAKGGMSLALGDVDGDGFLDLYVANYRTLALMDMPNTLFNFATVNGQRVVSRVNGRPVSDPLYLNRYRLGPRGSIEENGEADGFFRNAGGKKFEERSFTDGTFLDEDGRPLSAPPFDWGLSVSIRDLNQDGLPDIWVCNDFDAPERVWLNQGGGKFRAAPRLAFRKSSHFSMGIDVADINRDGFDDIFVVDMLSRDHAMRMDMQGDRNLPAQLVGAIDNRPDYMMNTLFLNRGDGTYAEIAQLACVSATEWSWTPAFLDVDLDGYEDLLVSNGHERMARSLDVADKLRALRAGRKLTAQEVFENRKMFPRQNSPNIALRNRGDLTFEDVTTAWGFGFDGVSHGMALADLDNDGDLDVLVNNLNDPAGIYRNDSSSPRIGVRLKGAAPNTRGIGASIRVLGGAVPMQSQQMVCGGRYLSSDDPMRVFAAGSPTNAMTIEVTWRSGRRSVVRGAMANRIHEVSEVDAVPVPASNAPQQKPFFADVSTLINHVHQDEPFADFSVQPLLPNQLSQLGPGLAWCDFDGDGWDDLVIGGGKGGRMAAYRNDAKGGFQPQTGAPFAELVTRDQTGVLLWSKKNGEAVLLAGSSNQEDGSTNGAAVLGFNLTRRVVEDVVPGQPASTGPMAMADVDGDGQLDLFVGGRAIMGRWPEAASSRLFRGTGDGWMEDAEAAKVLANVGLVSGAVFCDLDGDGDSDLVLACEWGTLKIFRNDKGRLVAWNPAVSGLEIQNPQIKTLIDLTGWWTGVTTADFDGDGRPDILAGNWGRNTRFEIHRAEPLELVYGDFNGDGSVEIVEAYRDPITRRLLPERQLDHLARAMPFLKTRFDSHMEFGRMSVEEIMGEHWSSARRLSAAWLESTVFLNRGDHFEARVLPVEAQMAPVFGVCAGDFDGDGREDAFLSQNFFASQPETPRHDGGRGLWLRGDGAGNFAAVSGQEGGVLVYGEQRGAALADFDGDGRVDLAVTQNGAATKLYRNERARAGLRVRLAGPPGNKSGVGAVLRVVSGGKAGPAREIHAGSGYWSQDSAVQVMALPAGAVQLQVRWPGLAAPVTVPVPPGALECSIGMDGQLKVTR